MDASRGEREMLAAMTEMLLFIQEDPRTGRGFFLCRRDIADSTVVSPFFLFSFFFPRCGGPSITEQPDTIEFGRQRCAMEIESPIAAGPVHP
jgi:hypothetical protein